MPLIGLGAGGAVANAIGDYNNWVAFVILLLIGAKMLKEAFSRKERSEVIVDRTRKWSLVFLSLATSIDALGAGFGIGLIAGNMLLICAVIGVTALLMTIAGMILGRYMRKFVGQRIEAIGGLILIGIGFKILLG